jgi:hypothetical protein
VSPACSKGVARSNTRCKSPILSEPCRSKMTSAPDRAPANASCHLETPCMRAISCALRVKFPEEIPAWFSRNDITEFTSPRSSGTLGLSLHNLKAHLEGTTSFDPLKVATPWQNPRLTESQRVTLRANFLIPTNNPRTPSISWSEFYPPSKHLQKIFEQQVQFL